MFIGLTSVCIPHMCLIFVQILSFWLMYLPLDTLLHQFGNYSYCILCDSVDFSVYESCPSYLRLF